MRPLGKCARLGTERRAEAAAREQAAIRRAALEEIRGRRAGKARKGRDEAGEEMEVEPLRGEKRMLGGAAESSGESGRKRTRRVPSSPVSQSAQEEEPQEDADMSQAPGGAEEAEEQGGAQEAEAAPQAARHSEDVRRRLRPRVQKARAGGEEEETASQPSPPEPGGGACHSQVGE